MLTATAAIAALLLSGVQTTEGHSNESAALASEALAEGRATRAIQALERQVEAAPEDPALLINLGIAHAQAGSSELARTMFQRALVSPDQVELETAEGKTIDSRRLARKAMRMLERGEFSRKLTHRD